MKISKKYCLQISKNLITNVILYCVLILIISACSSQKIDDGPKQEPVIMPTGDYIIEFETPDPEIYKEKFSLTDEQQRLFNTYSKNFNFDISIFKDADPVDIGQVYIECGLQGYWEGEWNLLSLEGMEEPPTKLKYKEEYQRDFNNVDIRSRRDQANMIFSFFKDGKFIKEDDNVGWVEFPSLDPNDKTYKKTIPSKLHFILNKNGIWQIRLAKFLEWGE